MPHYWDGDDDRDFGRLGVDDDGWEGSPMTLSDAIKRLQKLLERYGDVELFFDCPNCAKSFAPNSVVPLAAHMTSQYPPEK